MSEGDASLGKQEERNRQVVLGLWRAFDARDWDAASASLHEDVVVDWPVSAERIRGRENVLGVNRHYPGDWTISVRRTVAEGDEVVTHVAVRLGGQTHHALSFYRLRDGRIASAVEWWPEPYEPPAGRERWVEPLTSPFSPGDDSTGEFGRARDLPAGAAGPMSEARTDEERAAEQADR
jgi:ketosteroid isomerase-like protein